MLDASFDAAFAFDARGIVLDWNPAAESLFGWSAAEVVGRELCDHVLAGEAGERRAVLARALDGLEARLSHGRSFQLVARGPDRAAIPITVRIAALREHGRLFYLAVAALRRGDETPASGAAKAPERAADLRFFETILRHAPVGIALIERAGFVVRFANPAFEAFTPGRALVGRSAREIWPEIADDLEELYRRVLDGGEPHHDRDRPFALRSQGGHFEERAFTFSFVPIASAAGRADALLVVAIETTEQVRTRRQIAESAQEAIRLDRVRADFVRAAAHELNTPVAVLSGYTQALARHAESASPAVREILDGVGRGIARIRRIVRDLLYVSRIELGQIELSASRVQVETVVRREAARISSHRRVPIVVDAAPLPAAAADVEAVEQVVRNLLENAARYAAPQTRVEVAITAVDDEITIAVRDRGAGIATDKQARIGERFYRAHAGTAFDYEGLGVGLHISRELVTRQGGRLWFESVEGEGSTFHVSWPIAPEERTSVAPGARA